MDGMWVRVGTQLLARVSGPMKFRLVLQPCMAAFFAIRSGMADAKAGRHHTSGASSQIPPNVTDMVKDGVEECWQGVHSRAGAGRRVSAHRVASFVYFGEMIIVAFVLAIVPYVMLRGLVMRVARNDNHAPSTRWAADPPPLRNVS